MESGDLNPVLDRITTARAAISMDNWTTSIFLLEIIVDKDWSALSSLLPV